MCTETGISRGLITDLKMERKTSITVDTAKKIADYFGVSVDRVLGSEQKEKSSKAECVKSIEDEHIQKAMLRMLFCSAVIIDGEKKEIELKGNMSDMLMDGEAELTAEDDCIVVKNLSNI